MPYVFTFNSLIQLRVRPFESVRNDKSKEFIITNMKLGKCVAKHNNVSVQQWKIMLGTIHW